MRKAWPALASVALVSTTRLASAEPTAPALDLVWDTPESCPGLESVRRRIEEILRGPLTAPNGAVARAKVETTHDGRYHLTMTVRTDDVEDARTVEAASCTALAEAFAVVVALAIDPTKEVVAIDELRVESMPAEPSPATFPKAVPPPKHKSSSPRPPTPTLPVRVAFGLGGSIVWGPLPEASPGVTATLGVRIDRFRVGAIGALAFRQSPHFDRDAGASFDMIEVGAFGAYMVPLGIFAIGPCVNVEATYVRAHGFGVRVPWTSSAVWPTMIVGGRVEVRVTRRLGLFARADLLFPIGAPGFALATPGNAVRLHSPSALFERLSLGAEVVFP